MRRDVLLPYGLLAFLFLVSARAWGGEVPRAFSKFCGRVPILGLPTPDNTVVPNPAALPVDPANPEDCTNGIDDNGDGKIDYGDGSSPNNGDPDCLGGLGPQLVHLLTPFDVVQPVGGATAAHFTRTDRNFDAGGEILVNTTGPGGRKHSYLRTDDPNRYANVTVRAVVLPGVEGDEGGPIALRIQGADDMLAGKSYYARVVPGDMVSIEKDNGDGTSMTLASANQWDSGEAITIAEYNAAAEPVLYQVTFTAKGSSLQLTVSELPNDLIAILLGSAEPVAGRTVSLEASDNELRDGYIGLRSDADNHDGEDAAPDDADSQVVDASVVDFVVSDPDQAPDPSAPRILYFSGVGDDIRDNLNYTTDPVTPQNYRPYRRTGTSISDQTATNYLRSVGFDVQEIPIDSFSAGFITPEDVNGGPWDILWLPGSGGSSATRGFIQQVTKPVIFSEHVAGSPEWGGAWQTRNNGNENPVDCSGTGLNCSGTALPGGTEGCETLTTLRVFPEEAFGDPDHPIIRGLADENGNIPVSDASQIPLNVGYPFPTPAPSISGAPFMDIQTVLEQRGWGMGASETQMGGWPPTEGAKALAGFVSPCDGSLLLQIPADPVNDPPPARGNTSLIAIEEGTPRTVEDPGACVEPCEWVSRSVFYWISDQAFHYSTAEALAIVRRMALWTVHLLDSQNRSARPFKRSDSDANGKIELTDAVVTFRWLFAGGREPPCLDAADSDDNEKIELTDGVFTLNWLFRGGRDIPPPFIVCFGGCGLDFTPAPEDSDGDGILDENEDPGDPTADPPRPPDPTFRRILSCNAYDKCR